MLPGRPEDYVEGPKSSGQWWRYDEETGEVFGPVAIRSDWTPRDLFAKHANPEPEPPDARDFRIAELEAAIGALKKSGVLTDEMISVEKRKKQP